MGQMPPAARIHRTSGFAAIPAPLSPVTSDTIAVARVVCITFMMTVHIWPGSDRILAADTFPAVQLFFRIVVDNLGRAAVPLLSLFSGMLFVHTFARSGRPLRVVGRKVRSLIVPMAIWSVPMLVLFYLEGAIFDRPHDWPTTALGWANQLFAITGSPANSALHFLREIFVMSCYGSLYLVLTRHSRLLALAFAVAVLCVEHRPEGFILFREFIGTAFFIGMFIAQGGHAQWVPSRRLAGGVLALYLAALWAGVPDWMEARGQWGLVWEYAMRLAMCLMMWRVCREIAEGAALGLRRLCLWLEPHIFLIFCTHKITIFCVGGIALLMGWNENQPGYILVFLAQIPLCIGAGVVVSILARPFPILSGSRRRAAGKRPSPSEV